MTATPYKKHIFCPILLCFYSQYRTFQSNLVFLHCCFALNTHTLWKLYKNENTTPDKNGIKLKWMKVCIFIAKVLNFCCLAHTDVASHAAGHEGSAKFNRLVITECAKWSFIARVRDCDRDEKVEKTDDKPFKVPLKWTEEHFQWLMRDF